MKKRTSKLILSLLLAILIIINYTYFDNYTESLFSNKEESVISRVIDGDTVELENGDRVRLLGINTPERGEQYYQEAKEFLESKTYNKTITLEKWQEDEDLYGRKLRYVFVEGININEELVKEGFASPYYPEGKDIYYSRLKIAWENCMKVGTNLCEKSTDRCAQCIEIRELNYETQRLVLGNKCSFSCDLKNWTIKDEGRKKFKFENLNLNSKKEVYIIAGDGNSNQTTMYWKEDYVWTKTGDSLFLRDSQNKLVIFYNYF